MFLSPDFSDIFRRQNASRLFYQKLRPLIALGLAKAVGTMPHTVLCGARKT